MRKKIYRNIAAVTAVFFVAFSIMLVTNYLQVRGTTPLTTDIMETLMELNAQEETEELQSQIRELDLLARNAYFTRLDHLESGIFILLAMLGVSLVCYRLYISDVKDLPEEKIDEVDEWAQQSKARRLILGSVGALGLVALVCGALSYLDTGIPKNESQDLVAEAQIDEASALPESVEESAQTSLPGEDAEASEALETEAAETFTSKVTSNAFRGNNASGVSQAKNLLTKWDLSGGDGILWKKSIPLEGKNTPIINGRKVFFTGSDGQVEKLFCYDLLTGEEIWNHEVGKLQGSPSQAPGVSFDTGYAASSCATNGSYVVAIFASGNMVCCDMDGKRAWGKNLGVPENHYGYASSLLTYGNSVIVQYDNSNAPKLMALQISSGQVKWSVARNEAVTWSSPMITYVDGKPQLVVMGNPGMTAYNPDSGEQIWRVEFLGGEVGSSAAAAGGIVFGANEYSSLVAVNAQDGSTLWDNTEYLPECSSPVAYNGCLFVATSYGVMACYDAKTGEKTKEHETGSSFYASPVVADGKIYMAGMDGRMIVYSADRNMNVLADFKTGENMVATPAFTDAHIIIRSENSIYCVASQN